MQENLPKITVDKVRGSWLLNAHLTCSQGIRRLDVAALKKVMESRRACACDGAGDGEDDDVCLVETVQETLWAQDWTNEQQQRRLAGLQRSICFPSMLTLRAHLHLSCSLVSIPMPLSSSPSPSPVLCLTSVSVHLISFLLSGCSHPSFC